VKIDDANKEIKASIFGLAARKAKYFPGRGCILDSKEKGVPKILNIEREPSAESGYSFQDSMISKPIFFRLEEHLDSCFDDNTASIIVLKDDRIIYERYASGVSVETPMTGWSMTKSWALALAAMRIQDGKLDLDDNQLFPQWEGDDALSSITLRNLLISDTGIKWAENYGSLSSVNLMLFEQDDAVEYVLKQPAAYRPNDEFNYSSGNTTLIGALLSKSFESDKEYHSYFYDRLAIPLGMKNAWIETDESGNLLLSSYGYATTRDWLRFGRLFLNNGQWEGETIIEPEFIKLASEATSVSDFEYGAHFWTNKGRKLPDVPVDIYSCNGHRGQRVFIILSQNMVVVRLGWEETDYNHLLSGIINALGK
jgi:CubicO group peptidase (beta-lactamase class C family)